MLSSILIGLDPFHDESDRLDFAIRVGQADGCDARRPWSR